MNEIKLPHTHGEKKQISQFKQELEKTARFAATSNIFKQLSDPNRLRIFWLLCHMEECVTDIAAIMDMSLPAVSYHLSSLAESGLLVSRREKKETLYRAADNEQSRLLHSFAERAMELSCPEKPVDYALTPEEQVKKVHDYLMEHISSHITISSLSERFLINPTSLKAAFKKVYGDSIANHMKRHRLEYAAQQLVSTSLLVGEIASGSGYESQSRFTAAFREQFGCTPVEYRSKHRKADNTVQCSVHKEEDNK